MAIKSGQRFIRENRKPRVHIEYEVETYGARQKVELPFVMGVMSDLSGKSLKDRKAAEAREFVEFDMDNFDQRMEAIAPRVAFAVDNTLGGDGGKLAVDLTFKSMNDLSPGEIAKNIEPLAKLLEARTQLEDLLSYMDGKNGAQDLLDKVLKDPALLQAISAAKTKTDSSDGTDDVAQS
ncbi:type VI secretion system contractile sheath small subunit [Sphingomonas alpina]|jgi:type VI secretion system protein ImpB|uniref:Type VI secretion system contractile sheath small subunit n=1 Tax=Sphingomonas alpina TaxID=653931 RepID=A0A7H0LIQ3_9SPHN|nr:type VI secretion system contractile sheath small subunit [Sphingomonas alpina]QNQ09556.1 type VI secretion system contractile sheath small subunit [Sphingomonas alpina]